MNQIFFGLKRAHHGVLRITRPGLAELGLTPARFDLLYALHRMTWAVSQRSLRGILGVSAPTVCRMLASLEELGLVRRQLTSGYRRRLDVHLTEEGRRRIRKAIRRFIKWGWAQLAVDSALCPDRWHDQGACFCAMDDCDSTLRAFRKAYGDVATLYFPWHPDD
ncbi:MAG TPA: MarR family transcriptional regulator [Polyangiaceae bacterium]|jgi:DNA-binding MarR family transcriptional regulator|nr:MarR family transcriptional regulator [Polyangiaceae bacterium]